MKIPRTVTRLLNEERMRELVADDAPQLSVFHVAASGNRLFDFSPLGSQQRVFPCFLFPRNVAPC